MGYYEVTAEEQPLTAATLDNINSIRAELELMESRPTFGKRSHYTP